MINTDLLDQLADALKAEIILRHQAAMEWAGGSKTGPMMKAHDDIINKIIQLAKQMPEI